MPTPSATLRRQRRTHHPAADAAASSTAGRPLNRSDTAPSAGGSAGGTGGGGGGGWRAGAGQHRGEHDVAGDKGSARAPRGFEAQPALAGRPRVTRHVPWTRQCRLWAEPSWCQKPDVLSEPTGARVKPCSCEAAQKCTNRPAWEYGLSKALTLCLR